LAHGLGLRQPVGAQECDVIVAARQAALRDGLVVQGVEIEHVEFDPGGNAAVPHEIGELGGNGAFEWREFAHRDAQDGFGHRVSLRLRLPRV
jgi:hypothetical protein